MDQDPNDSPSTINNQRENIAKYIVADEIKNVQSNPLIIEQNTNIILFEF